MTLQFKPGTGFGYSGEAYVRLQRAVEQSAGQPLNELIDSTLFAPWALGRSSYLWRPEFESMAAEGHDASGQAVRTRLWGFTPQSPSGPVRPGMETPPVFAVPNAAASLYTTARDYGRFLAQLLAPPAVDAAHLGKASLAQMFSPLSHPNADLQWGLGWGLGRAGKLDTFWHWGNNNVYQSFVVGCRERRSGLVVFTNSANGLMLCREIVNRYLGTEHPAFRWKLVMPQ
jgi:CubicO group peptidase (beta-lactamase class C family)